ncbi:MAG: ABC transporter ATP-binding protein, partial [Flavobacteriaceae bacterium]|nr:ABC transporter ATP-binding protein [Flavobacteriaceae bacterium]
MEVSGKAFDSKIFSRLMNFARVYRLHFYLASVTAILLSLVSALRPWLLQQTIDKYISTKDSEGLLIFIVLML